MRRCVLIALAFLTAVAPAHAAPRPLTRISGLSEIAPAGEQILVSRRDRTNLRLRDPGDRGRRAPGVLLRRAQGPAPRERPSRRFGAAGRAIDQDGQVVLGQHRRHAGFRRTGGGGWSGLPPFTDPHSTPNPFFVSSLQVDGERIIIGESRGGFDDLHVVVRDPDPHEVSFASADEAMLATFAGDFVAYRARAADESVDDRDLGNVLVVRDWQTGAVLSAADLQDDIGSIALRPDGRVAATTDGGLYELRPGAPARLLTPSRRLGGLRG